MPGQNDPISYGDAFASFLRKAGAGLVPLETASLSSDGEADFTAGFDGTYQTLLFRIVSVVPATDNVVLTMRVKVGGSFQTTGYRWASRATDHAGTAGSFGSGTTSDATRLQLIPDVGSAASEGASGWVWLDDPSNTILPKYVTWGGGRDQFNDLTGQISGFGAYRGGMGAVEAVRFKFSSGDLESGSIMSFGWRAAA